MAKTQLLIHTPTTNYRNNPFIIGSKNKILNKFKQSVEISTMYENIQDNFMKEFF